MDLGLVDRVALVTGASGGIGAAIARTLAAEGARIALGYHASEDVARRLLTEIEEAGGSCVLVKHDLRDPVSLRAGVAAIRDAWGRLDILVAGAWVAPGWAAPDSPAESIPAEVWQEQLRTNAEGTAYTVQAVLPEMRAGGFGRIVLISSGAAAGAPGMEAYGAAKAALHGLARSLAASAGPAGILCNVVMPGLIPTARHRQTIPQSVLDQIAGQTPTRRLATEEDVARVVAFLASAANRSVTGVEVRVCGGLFM
jgi:NAD(P)-dependent dehydrogenase (short-subunit alcohol dehydrogenase family)